MLSCERNCQIELQGASELERVRYGGSDSDDDDEEEEEGRK